MRRGFRIWGLGFSVKREDEIRERKKVRMLADKSQILYPKSQILLFQYLCFYMFGIMPIQGEYI